MADIKLFVAKRCLPRLRECANKLVVVILALTAANVGL